MSRLLFRSTQRDLTIVPQYFIARGCIISANVFLTNSFVFLASSDAGCVDENRETIADCDGSTYGMAPSSLIVNIQVIAGILAALMMPLFGAIIDYTSYRREAGIFVGALLALIQATQIGTGNRTWFFMAILQGKTRSVALSTALLTRKTRYCGRIL